MMRVSGSGTGLIARQDRRRWSVPPERCHSPRQSWRQVASLLKAPVIRKTTTLTTINAPVTILEADDPERRVVVERNEHQRLAPLTQSTSPAPCALTQRLATKKKSDSRLMKVSAGSRYRLFGSPAQVRPSGARRAGTRCGRDADARRPDGRPAARRSATAQGRH